MTTNQVMNDIDYNFPVQFTYALGNGTSGVIQVYYNTLCGYLIIENIEQDFKHDCIFNGLSNGYIQFQGDNTQYEMIMKCDAGYELGFFMKSNVDKLSLFFEKLFPHWKKDLLITVDDHQIKFQHPQTKIHLHILLKELFKPFLIKPDTFAYGKNIVDAFRLYDLENSDRSLSFFKGQAFHKKKYAESFFENKTLKASMHHVHSITFFIGTKKISIGKPSSLFSAFFLPYVFLGEFQNGWDDILTVKMENIMKEEVEATFQQVEFHVSEFFPRYLSSTSNFEMKFKNSVVFFNQDVSLLNNQYFPVPSRIDPLALYNEGSNQYGEDQFLHYYRVLENYFYEVKTSKTIEIVSNYQQSQKHDELMKKLKKLNAKKEKQSLFDVLKEVENLIQPSIDKALDEGIITNKNIKTFSDTLYDFRNSIVHAKEEEKDNVRIPRILKTNEDKFWFECIKRISLQCIKHFSF